MHFVVLKSGVIVNLDYLLLASRKFLRLTGGTPLAITEDDYLQVKELLEKDDRRRTVLCTR